MIVLSLCCLFVITCPVVEVANEGLVYSIQLDIVYLHCDLSYYSEFINCLS